MAGATSFVAPKRRLSESSAGGGRKQWNIGDRLWDMHIHAPKLLNRYLAAVQEQEDAGRLLTNAATLGLRQPEILFDASQFASDVLRPDRSEVANRPHIGLSMLVGTMAIVGVREWGMRRFRLKNTFRPMPFFGDFLVDRLESVVNY